MDKARIIPKMNPITIAVLAALAGTSPSILASPSPGSAIGSPIAAPLTGGLFSDAAVGMDAAGDSVIAWSEYAVGTGFTVYAQRYGLDGKAQGAKIQVSATSSTQLTSTKVAMDAAGDFVVSWNAYTNHAPQKLMVHPFSADGTSIADPSQVNTSNGFSIYNPSVAMDAAGDFAVGWTGYDTTSSDYVVYARRYTSDGDPAADQFMVNSSTAPKTSYNFAGIGMDAAGDMVVEWESGPEIFVQRFDSTGAAQGSNTRVSDVGYGAQQAANITMDAEGDFVVTWDGYYHDTAPDAYHLFAQRFSADGTAKEAGFEISSYQGSAETPGIAMDATGDFVVTWQTQAFDSPYPQAFMRRYTSAGTAATSATLIDPSDAAANIGQAEPWVAMDAAGDYVAMWRQNGVTAQVFARDSSIDLSAAMSISGPVTQVAPGTDVTLIASVTNQAGASTPTGNAAIDAALTDATGVTAYFTLPRGLALQSASGTDWGCSVLTGVSLANLVCTYTPALAAGETSPDVQVTLSALSVPKTAAPTALTFINIFTADQADDDLINNIGGADATLISPRTIVGASLVANHNTPTSSALTQSLGLGSYSITTPPQHGTLTLRGNGSYTYTPALNYSGSDSFDYQVHKGAFSPAPGTVTVMVLEHPPVAARASFRTPHDSTHAGKLKASDPDAGDKLVFSQATAPSHGTLTINTDGSYRYKSAHGYTGVDSFSFQVSDGSETSTATVNVTVD